MKSAVEVTIVICTHNRADFLRPCVASVLRQSVPRERYEVLVVDNASSDHTGTVARELARTEGIRYLFEPALGLSHARNRGWREAAGRIVAYLDDDATAEPGWMESALDSFRTHKPEPAWVGGAIDLDCEVPMPAWLGRAFWHVFGHLDWGDEPRVLEPGYYLGGGNSFFVRRKLETMGGFDPRLGRQGRQLLAGEETYLEWRLRHAGEILYYHPGVRIRHHVPAERLRRSWIYRHAYWNGVTGSVMQALLKDQIGSAFDLHAHSPTPQAGHRVARVVRQSARALGVASSACEAVEARAYLSYVLGTIAGLRVRHRIPRQPGERDDERDRP